MLYVDKKDLTIKNGKIIHEGQLVQVNPDVIRQANVLETQIQEKAYNDKLPKAGIYAIEPFARKSFIKSKLSMAKPETPLHDKAEEQILALAAECEQLEAYQELTSVLGEFSDLIEFVTEDTVLVDEAVSFKTVTLDVSFDLLSLTEDGLRKLFNKIV